ncbi:MAG: hypothetical protein PHF60_00950 [Candidatus ainarchaeum sp.]|nr:hypothetical protein [Candidatus ainarchaeum sp.]
MAGTPLRQDLATKGAKVEDRSKGSVLGPFCSAFKAAPDGNKTGANAFPGDTLEAVTASHSRARGSCPPPSKSKSAPDERGLDFETIARQPRPGSFGDIHPAVEELEEIPDNDTYT